MTAFHAMTPPDEHELALGILGRVATDLSMVVDREFQIDDVRVERRSQRPEGKGCVHISFKLSLDLEGQTWQGCVLVPLPDAVSLAAYMMMLPDEAVARERGRTELDGPFKEALLEVGKFLAGACDSVLRQAVSPECSTCSDGCQGVRAGVRPALAYGEGQPLLVARARARVHDFEPFELILVLPGLELLAAAESPSV